MTKVFVSSKQGELDPERAALHQALQSAEWDNFTIEFSGAFSDDVRAVFLQHVVECDVYLGIFASVYSQPTVDEYHKAKGLGKPILIYLKRCANRDTQLQDFIRAELQPSFKYQEFSTTEELVSHLPDIRRALDAEMQKHQRQAYLNALVAHTELLELAGIVDTGEQERPKLQDIYIALSAAKEVEERDERQPKRERDERRPQDKRKRERPIKITRRVTIDQALCEHRNLMILGDPGAGKSTLLRYLTLVAALGDVGAKHASPLPEPRLPIFIRLSSFAQSKQSFIEYFETYAKTQLHVSLGEKFFERALEDGQAIVCLDGLDEVSQPAQRIDVRNAITTLANRYPGRNRFIVTSRVAGYDSASLDKRAFAHHTIVPFGEKEIQAFVEKWYAARERETEHAKTRAANLFNDLKANERLLKLAENPLTLTIIALVHQRAQGKLPDARIELYDRCAETLIEEWDKWKGIAPEDRARTYYRLRRRLLERAAYWMHIESQDADVAQISKHALEMKVAEFLVEDKTLNLSEDTARIEAKQFVALATSRTGILVEREQGAVSFIHLTFQEYYAASDLYWRYRKTPDALWQAIQPHLYDSRWLEVILLLLGRLNDERDTPSIIVEKILLEHDKFDDVIHRDLFLAARCLADRVNVNETLRNEIVDTLLRFGKKRRSGSQLLSKDAIQALGTLSGNDHASNGLRTLAQSKNAFLEVRLDAAQALAHLGYKQEAAYFFLAVAQHRKMYTGFRAYAARMLGQISYIDDFLIESLMTLAQDVKKKKERQISFISADDTQYIEVRSSAADALGQLGLTDHANHLLLAISQDKKEDRSVREEALQALGRLGCVDDYVIDGLIRLIGNRKENVKVREASAQLLAQLGHKEEAALFFLTLAHNKMLDPFDQEEAARTVGQLGFFNDKEIHELLDLLQNEKAKIEARVGAAEALGHLDKPNETVLQVLSTVS